MNKEEVKVTKAFMTASTKLMDSLRRQFMTATAPKPNALRKIQAEEAVTKATTAFDEAERALQTLTVVVKPASSSAAPASIPSPPAAAAPSTATPQGAKPASPSKPAAKPKSSPKPAAKKG